MRDICPAESSVGERQNMPQLSQQLQYDVVCVKIETPRVKKIFAMILNEVERGMPFL